MTFAKAILSWYSFSKRNLPFRNTKDPYYIWISEIMSQQTKIESVIPYYKKWIIKYPKIELVANAHESDLLKVWEGLGYYSRCRNFHKASKVICEKFNGIVPDSFEEFISLPGVGDYTAGSVLSIAFNKNYIALDGNAKRVMSRIIGIKNITKYNLNKIKSTLEKLLDKKRPGDFNQAIMELGSQICKPKTPKCFYCPITKFCAAYKTGNPSTYPIKTFKSVSPKYSYVAGLIRDNGKILIHKRKEKLLNGLWELPNLRIGSKRKPELILKKFIYANHGINIKCINKLFSVNHNYSHFKMEMKLFDCKKINSNTKSKIKYRWINYNEINKYAFHKVNHKIFEKLKYD